MIRVVLVDDQAMVRTGLRMVLAAESDMVVVGEAADGAGGVRVVTEQQPDVVLLDVRMPGMDGIQALPEIHARAPKAQIVMLSSADPSDLEERTRALGATAFVRKPHDIFEVPAALRAAFA